MFYPYTERQAHFMAIAQALAVKFAARAAEHDRLGTFPHENYADVRAAGLPALIVPKTYGGWDANLLETLVAMETLAIGDGSTALNVTMHMQTLGDAIESRSWPPALLERICREAVERGALINSIASEPELGSPSRGGKPKSTAQPIYEGASEPVAWIVNGHKSYGSMSPALDYMIISAVLQDGSEDVARFIVEPSAGVEIVETWDALGMRTTGSHDVLFHDVRVPAANMLGRASTDRGASKATQGMKTNPWFMLCVSAVYVGVAMAAQQTAVRYAKERVPTALGKPIAELENIQHHLGQAELLLQQARMQLYTYANLWDQHPDRRVELSPGIIGAKVIATNLAIQVVDQCMRVVGGASMTKALPLERYYRDVRGGLNHPVNEDQALVMLGRLTVSQT